MATAKHRAIDSLRRAGTLERKQQELVRELEVALATEERTLELDDVARTTSSASSSPAAIPVLSTEARIALTLRLLGGLTTPEIARAFLVSEATVAQRIVRAKRTLAEAHVPFEVPSGDELAPRLASVLEVIYLSSTRATRRRPATTGRARTCATRRCGSGACSPSWRRASPRSTGSSR